MAVPDVCFDESVQPRTPFCNMCMRLEPAAMCNDQPLVDLEFVVLLRLWGKASNEEHSV